MNLYCVDLNWDIPLLAPDVDINIFKKQIHTKGNLTDIHPLLLQHLANKGVSVSLLETFYSKPDYVQGIHIDGIGGDYSKLNWIYGCTNSLMHWYKLKDGVVVDIKTNTIGKQYSEYNRTQLKLLHSHSVGRPSLVQVGIPHNISNKQEDRLCISLAIFKDNTRLSMQQAIDLLI